MLNNEEKTRKNAHENALNAINECFDNNEFITERNLTQYIEKFLKKEKITNEEKEEAILTFKILENTPYHQMEFIKRRYNDLESIYSSNESTLESSNEYKYYSDIFEMPKKDDIVSFKYENGYFNVETYSIITKIVLGTKKYYLLKLLAIDNHPVDEEPGFYTFDKFLNYRTSEKCDGYITKVFKEGLIKKLKEVM